jgi:hypothetical protein
MVDFDAQGVSASKLLLTIPKINFLMETCSFKFRSQKSLFFDGHFNQMCPNDMCNMHIAQHNMNIA